jgi:hypothetical protein
MAGYPDQARCLASQVVAEAKALGHPHSRAFTLGFASFPHEFCGEVSRVAELADEQSALCRESASGTLCHGDAAHGRGHRRHRAFMLPILTVSFLAAGERKPLQEVPILAQEAFDQRGAVDGAGDADDGGHARDDLRVRGQGLEGVHGPLGVRDDEPSESAPARCYTGIPTALRSGSGAPRSRGRATSDGTGRRRREESEVSRCS